VQAFLDAVDEFVEETDASRAAFEAYVRTFYGFEAAETSTGPDAEEETEEEADDEAADPAEEESEDTDEAAEPAEEESDEPETESETSFGGSVDDFQAESEPEEPDEGPEDMVECRVCGEYYQAITEPHLRTHDMTIDEYREEYGDDVPLRPDEE
ncbi:MAG: hypothetical protein ACI8VE_001922, partial [Natrialbaceae archaeon]